MKIKRKVLSSVKDKPYFVGGNFVLYNNDCLKILEQLPENSAEQLLNSNFIFSEQKINI